jgi:putative MATE family efflux protein
MAPDETSAASPRRADFTEGPILESILRMGLPSMFGFLVQHIYTLVDMYWVSNLPDAEASVAAVTFVGNILWVLFSFNQLVGPGSVAIISRRYGEKRYELVAKAIREAVLLKLIFGAVFGVAGFFAIESALRLIGAQGEALTLGVAYGRVYSLGLPIMFATYTIFTAMRGVANPNMAFLLMLVSNVLNMILDPLLLFGYLGFPAMGITGAAVASVISFTFTFGVGIGLFLTGRTHVRLDTRVKDAVSLGSMGKMVRIGVPAWFGDLSFSGARMVVMIFVAAHGTSVVAAYGIGNQIVTFGIMIVVGIGLGLSSLIGHNVGAGKIARAKKTGDAATWLGTAILTALGIVVFAGAEPILRVFFDSPDTVAQGLPMLRIFALGLPFLGAFIVMIEIHLGVGLNTPPMICNLIHSWLLQVLPIWWISGVAGYPVIAIWWTMTVGEVLNCAGFWVYYRRGRWLRHRV